MRLIVKENIEELAEKYKQALAYVRNWAEKITGEKPEDNLDIPTLTRRISSYLESIIAQIPGSVYWKDVNLVYLGCNDGAAELVGVPREKMCGIKDDFFAEQLNMSPEVIKSFREADLKILKGEKILKHEELPFRDGHGKTIYQLSNRVPLYNENYQIIGILGISIDISDRKEMELALLEEKERAETANRVKTEFMQNMSHDFKTPLNGIYGVVQILRDRKDLPDDIKELIVAQEKSVLRLKSLIDTILDFDRLYAGKVNIYSEPINLLEIIESVVDNLSSQSHNKDLNLIIDYPPEVPNYLISDSHCITSIILNLMTNAVKFTEQGYINISVKEVSQENENIQLNIEIEDSGIGMKEGIIPQIFDRFNRIEPSNKGLKAGHGLGLAIVKELVTKLNGTISVKSQVGIGSTFSVNLPFKLQDCALIISQWQNINPNSRVLLVNDKKTATDTILDQLGSVTVKKVKSESVINELVTASQSNAPFHIIIIDSEIEFIDSFSLVKIIKSSSVIPKIMPLLSTHPQDNEWLDKARSAGYFEFIIKPVLPSELQRKLSNAWEKWQQT